LISSVRLKFTRLFFGGGQSRGGEGAGAEYIVSSLSAMERVVEQEEEEEEGEEE